MGVWGPELYSNDLASDVRNDYREMLVLHYTHHEAMERIIREHELSETDPHDAAGWFALADCAWKYGHLDEQLKQFVMKLIDEGIEDKAGIWDYSGDRAKRKKILEKLHQKIQKPPEKISKPYILMPGKADWNEGDLIAVRMLNGEFINEYMVILIVRKEWKKVSRFAREGDVYPDYYFVVLTYHSKSYPEMNAFSSKLCIYCNREDPDGYRAAAEMEGTAISGKHNAQMWFGPYDFNRETKDIFSRIGTVDVSLIHQIQEEITKAYLHTKYPTVWGECLFDFLRKQNLVVPYAV